MLGRLLLPWQPLLAPRTQGRLSKFSARALRPFLVLHRWSSQQVGTQRLVCEHAEEVVQVLLKQELEPLQQRSLELQGQLEPLERNLRSLEGCVLDCKKHIAAARQHVVSREEDAAHNDSKVEELKRQLSEKETERSAKGDEYRYQAHAVGIDEAAADAMLKHVCKNTEEAQRAPLLQAFAQVHRECLDIQRAIMKAEAGAVKSRIIASEKRAEAGVLLAKEQAAEGQRDELERCASNVRAGLGEVSVAQARLEADARRMLAAAAWAHRISPTFLSPTVDNLPMLLLHRHQAIQAIAMASDESCLSLLRELSCTADELAEFSDIAARLQRCGFSVEEMSGMGFSLHELRNSGFPTPELLAAGFTASQLKEAGFDLQQLKLAGLAAAKLRETGFSLQEFLEAGFTTAQLKDADFSAVELNAEGISLKQLKLAGLAAAELKDVGFNLRELLEAGFAASQLKAAGFSAAEMHSEGMSVVQLIEAGFRVQELLDAHLDKKLVKMAYHTSCGLSVSELFRKGFTLSQLKQAGFSVAHIFKRPRSTVRFS